MSTFNTLLLIQTAEGQPEIQEQAVITQGEPVAQETYTEQSGQDSSPLPAQKEKGFESWIFILLIIVVFYLFLIRPQSKRAKEERKFREALKKGDKIVTTSGIHGKIVEMEETTAVIETEGQGKLRIEKIAIGRQQSS